MVPAPDPLAIRPSVDAGDRLLVLLAACLLLAAIAALAERRRRRGALQGRRGSASFPRPNPGP